MILVYSVIILLVIALGGLFFLYVNSRKRNRADNQKNRNVITLLKMQTIRNRMSPHFFFNALSGISAEPGFPEIIKKDFQTLLMLLRRSTENIEQTAIPVIEELEVIKGYISLQRWRVPEPFNVVYDIKEGTNLSQLIPAMILQIPVENAIKHGLMPLTGDKFLRIKIGNNESGLQITVEDNGIGYTKSGNRSTGAGTGLKILYQTIHLLNSGNSAKIEFSIGNIKSDNKPGSGTIVEIKVPANYSYDILTDKYEQA